ncbi:MAG TPA: PilZ domain-containing protein [Thermoanaerobaculia bacterium]|nr:PilZ domain-containing protein [Thermoanaerobaculia bacterium]
MSDERRQFQRLNLSEPLDAWFGDFAVRLLNVSATGALIECDEPIPADARALLRFWWRGAEIELLAEMRRHGGDGAGLAFLDDTAMIRDFIADSAIELLRAQEANAIGDRERNVFGDETLTAASSPIASGYITWTYGENGWKSRPSLVPDQPADGFTISAGESADQIALLCHTYEGGDAEARRLTRMLAELSVAGRRQAGQ